MTRKALLVCGVLASLLYVGTDIFATMRYEGYTYTDQTTSELSAVDAPTRSLAVPLFLTYAALMIAFGLGVWQSAGRIAALRVVAGLLVGYGVACFVGPWAPMHQRAVLAAGGGTFTDTMHIAVTIVTVLFILLIIGFAAKAFGRQFRLYSIGTLLVVVVFGALGGLNGPRLSAGLPTPLLGVTERICIFGSLLWMAVLAIKLLRSRDAGAWDDAVERVGRLPQRASA